MVRDRFAGLLQPMHCLRMRYACHTIAKAKHVVGSDDWHAVSLCALVVGTGLVLSELALYLTDEVTSQLGVDRTEGQEHLTIYLDMSFWHLPCQDVELEVQDAKGRLYNPKRVHVSKRSLVPGSEPGQGNVAGILSSVSLMVKSKAAGNSQEAPKPGCRVFGDMDVNRVAGNFHVVPRAFSAKGAASMYRGMPLEDLQHYNASHTVNLLRFGSAFPGQKNPLDGVTTAAARPAQFQYFAQVVPTVYRHVSGLTTEGNQMSVTQHTAFSDPTSPYMVPPGFVVRFDLNPIIVTLASASPGLGRLLTGICAVIGGVYAVASMLDKAVHGGIAAVSKAD